MMELLPEAVTTLVQSNNHLREQITKRDITMKRAAHKLSEEYALHSSGKGGDLCKCNTCAAYRLLSYWKKEPHQTQKLQAAELSGGAQS